MTEPADAPPPAPVSLSDEEIADLRSARAERDALKAKADADRLAEREARKVAQAEAERTGEVAKALEAAKQRLAELEGLAPLADRWRQHESAEVARLDKRAADLPAEFADLYKSAGDLASKSKILAAYDAIAVKPGKTVHTPPVLGAPPPVGVIDFDQAFRDQRTWDDAKVKDPTGAIAWFKSKMFPATSGQKSTLSRA